MVVTVNPRTPFFRLAASALISLGAFLAAADIGSAQQTGIPKWIWKAAEADDREEVLFRRSFTLERIPRMARVTVACDNAFELFVNGRRTGAGNSWEDAQVFDVREVLREGKNVLAVRGRNAGGIAGLALQLETGTRRRESAVFLVSDGEWRCSGEAPADWIGVDFNDAAWPRVHVHGSMGMPPWGPVFTSVVKEGAPQTAEDVTAQYSVPEGFRVERIYRVPKSAQGSWVSLAVDGDGRVGVPDDSGRRSLGDC
jgi:hypothetical protein